MGRAGDTVASFGETILLGGRAIAAVPRRPLEIRGFVRELYVQANRALGLALLIAAFSGLVIAFQFGEGLARFGARQYIGQLTTLALARELMPVLVALVLGGRIAAGIAAEIGSMAATEQIDAVRALGADPVKKLVMPRVIATTIVLPIFTVIGDVVGTMAGMVIAHLEFGVSPAWYLRAIRDFMLVGDFTSGLFKAAVFGLASSVIACRAGLATRGGTEGVGRATTGAVVASSLAVIVLDFLMTRMFFSAAGVAR